jgi:hypothetical protein
MTSTGTRSLSGRRPTAERSSSASVRLV